MHRSCFRFALHSCSALSHSRLIAFKVWNAEGEGHSSRFACLYVSLCVFQGIDDASFELSG